MKKGNVRYTIGTDPEFFLKRHGKFISAIPFIGNEEVGTKYNPLPLTTIKGGSLQRDNVALEFASPPAKTKEEFVENIRACLREINAYIPKDTTLEAVPSARFTASELKHPEAKQFGCDPDFDAWRVQQNERPECDDPRFRSCGGHIHVGGLDDEGNPIKDMEFLLKFEGKINLVKAMDIMVGIPATILDNSKEAVARRKLYGKAGCHRITEYGVEYRTLSNFWLKTPELVMLIYSLTGDAIKLVKSGLLDDLINTISAEEIIRVINAGDASAAMKLMTAHLVQFMSQESIELFKMCYEKLPNVKTLSAEWGL